MTARWWLLVGLTALLSAASAAAAVDQNKLGGIVAKILERYQPRYKMKDKMKEPMFSLAVTIPYDSQTKTYDVNQLDSAEDVKKTILNCDVFVGSRVVAATLLKWPDVLHQCPNARVQWKDVLAACPEDVTTWADVKNNENPECRKAVKDRADHAEYRVLEKMFSLFNSLNRNDLLLFYVLASPCDAKCTNQENAANILYSIIQIKKWDHYAVVFSKIFKPRFGSGIPEKNLRESLVRLGTHDPGQIGLSNIFRCNEGGCTSCSSDNQVTPYCYSDPEPASGILPASSFTQSEQGAPASASPIGQRGSSATKTKGCSSNADSETRAGQEGSTSRPSRGTEGGKKANSPKHRPARKVGGRRMATKQKGGNKQKPSQSRKDKSKKEKPAE